MAEACGAQGQDVMKQGEQATLHRSCIRSAMVAEMALDGMCATCIEFYHQMLGVKRKVQEWEKAYFDRLRRAGRATN